MVDSYYANGKLDFEENENFEEIGRHAAIVLELIRTKQVANMNYK